MLRVGDRIKELRLERGWSQQDLADRMDMNRVNISNYERGTINNMPSDALVKFSNVFDVSTDYLLGKSNNKSNSNQELSDQDFTEKDYKDIGKRMEKIRIDLENSDGLMFSGEPLTEEAMDSLMDAMEYIVKHTQRVNKKYIPKKHRK